MNDVERIAKLEQRVADLSEAVTILLDHAEKQRGDGDSPSGGAPSWLHASPPEADDADTWVRWWNENYRPTRSADRIPECWREHPGLMAEVLTLHATWQAAFADSEAEATAAQNWHDRWLPGFLHRMRTWVEQTCLQGEHRDRAHSPR